MLRVFMAAIDKIGQPITGPEAPHRRGRTTGKITRLRSPGRVASGDGVVPSILLAAGVLVGVLLVLHYNSSALHRALGGVGGIGLGGLAAINIVAVSLCAAA